MKFNTYTKLSILISIIIISSVISLKNKRNHSNNNNKNKDDTNGTIIGAGGFGEAKLITDKLGNQKVMKKSHIRKRGGEFWDHRSILFEKKIYEYLQKNNLCQEYIVNYLGSNNKNDEYTKVYDEENKKFLTKDIPMIYFGYEKGGDLDHKLKKERPKRKIINKLMYKYAAALNCLHKNNVFHKDILPRNIFLSDNTYNVNHIDDFKIGDFGVATVFQPGFDFKYQELMECLRRDIANYISVFLFALFPQDNFGKIEFDNHIDLTNKVKNALLIHDEKDEIFIKFVDLIKNISPQVDKLKIKTATVEDFNMYKKTILHFDSEMMKMFNVANKRKHIK